MRSFVLVAITLSPAVAQDAAVQWLDARKLTVEGQGWKETKAPFDRLPAKAEGSVRPAVWSLSQHSAGICVRFQSDATEIHARWKLRSAKLEMPHMPSTGVSGLDLYARDTKGKWRWVANGRPSKQDNQSKLVSGLSAQMREYMLYFPLYNGVTSVEVGVPAAAKLEPGKPRAAGASKPIVFYGTSITQGGCASRPGMVHTAILGRWLDCSVINLGFSGNGRMESEIGQLMAEIDASVYVIDCLPNISAAQVTERTFGLVKELRKARPSVPIVLVEDRNYTDSVFVTSKARRNQSSQKALKAEFEKLKSAGIDNLHYVRGEDLLGDDGEGTVDSSHPTDLGFMRQAEAFHKVLKPLVGSKD